MTSINEKQKAIDSLNQAVTIYRTVGNKLGEASTLKGIGVVYDSLGENQKALEFYNQALPLLKDAGEKSAVAKTLLGIGRIHASFEKLPKSN